MTALNFTIACVMSFAVGFLVAAILTHGKVADLQDEVMKLLKEAIEREERFRALIQNQTASGGSPQSTDNGAQ